MNIQATKNNSAAIGQNTMRKRSLGLTLIELMVALALGTLLMVVIITMFSSAKASYRMQDGLTRIQEDGRIAIQLIGEEVRKAGFRKPVWNDPLNGYSPVSVGSANGASNGNDTLQFMYMSDTSCTGVLNVNIDAETSEPTADYKQVTFTVDNTGTLRYSCSFGSDPQNLTAQLTNQPVIDGVESFQVLYGVDTDFPPDFSINAWTTADNIEPRASVCMQSQYLCEAGGWLDDMLSGVPVAIKLGLLIASPNAAEVQAESQTLNVLDVPISINNDDPLMRKVYTTTVTLRNMTI